MSYIKAPKPNQQLMYDFLEDLRQSGDTNMLGAPPYLQAAFGISRDTAVSIVSEWMRAHSDPARILEKSVTGAKAGRLVTTYESAEESDD